MNQINDIKSPKSRFYQDVFFCLLFPADLK